MRSHHLLILSFHPSIIHSKNTSGLLLYVSYYFWYRDLKRNNTDRGLPSWDLLSVAFAPMTLASLLSAGALAHAYLVSTAQSLGLIFD